MSEWQTFAVGDAAEVFDGPHATPSKADQGPWYLSISSLNNGRFDFSRSAHLSEADLPRWTKRVAPRRGDTLFSYETRLGEAAYWNHDVPAALGRRMGLLRPKTNVVDPRYLPYAYLGPQFQGVIREKTLSGSTVDRIPVGEMPSWPLLLPPLEQQRAILEVVGSVDDLIENNRRRVQVLEGMARAIYREWFVKFRYPGHEDVPLVDSVLGPIPEGWKIASVEEVAVVDKGLSYKGVHLTDAGAPMANLKCIAPRGGFRRNGVKPYSGPYKPRHSVAPGDLVLANTDLTQSGTVIGSPALIPRRGFAQGGLLSHHLFAVRPREEKLKHFLYQEFAGPTFRAFARSVASGTTVLGFRPADLLSYRLAMPADVVLDQYAELAGSLCQMSEELVDAAESLASLRDLLLPKLVTGQVDVSTLDLDALVEGAVA